MGAFEEWAKGLEWGDDPEQDEEIKKELLQLDLFNNEQKEENGNKAV